MITNNTSATQLIVSGQNGDIVHVDFLQVKKSSLILRALNHKLRQQILKLLEEQTKLTVTEIYVQLRLEQSVASQHLAILRRAGIVKTQREGKFIYYLLDQERIIDIGDCVLELLR
ncbi:MAG: metalloregulator ArsR/SmtB family transcription factor [Chitinophagaceae bacterium]